MKKLEIKSNLGNTGLKLPQIVFGTSCLGNLYSALADDLKLNIIKEWFRCVEKPVVIDTAGKYGAGLALEVIGEGLKKININQDDIIISNKLGWYRTPLTTPEPTFEPGVWADIQHDAVQKISNEGIMECYEQGCELLGSNYKTEIVSVHDPDEYLGQASSDNDRRTRMNDIIGAYRALEELKDKEKVRAIGVGSKDWYVIRELTDKIEMDWVMLAISFTIMEHPKELLDFIDQLTKRGITIINSAVFHGGFLTGGEFYNYRKTDADSESDKNLFEWREKFYKICSKYNIKPSDACVQFGITPPGIISIALNTSKPERILKNVESVQCKIPSEFWKAMQSNHLIEPDYPYL